MPRWRPGWLWSARPMPCCLLRGIRRKACRHLSKSARLALPATETTIPPKRDCFIQPTTPSRATGAAACFVVEVAMLQAVMFQGVAFSLLIDQVERMVAASLQVMVQTYPGLPGLCFRCIVVIDHRGTPQTTAGIVVVTHDHQPGVLIHVHVPLGIQVTIVVLDIGFQYPYPSQLIAHMVGIDVARRQQIAVGNVR